MGGFGSGRPCQRIAVEDGLALATMPLVNAAKEHGTEAAGTITWGEGGGGASLGFHLVLSASENRGQIVLRYRAGRHQQEVIEAPIALDATRQPLGGVRWWFRCPVTGARCRKVYLPPNSKRFASRAAHGLAYRSQSRDRYHRAIVTAHRIRCALHAPLDIGEEVERPSRMHRKTFDRHMSRLDAAEAEIGGQILDCIKRMQAKG